MNPWSFYEHKPQLFEACIVAACAVTVLRQQKLGESAAKAAAWACLAWAVVGLVDYSVYAFGYTLAGLTASGVSSVQVLFEWLRVPLLAFGALSVHSATKRRSRPTA
jgi:hypothetical protein